MTEQEKKELQGQLDELKSSLETVVTEKVKKEISAQIKSLEDQLKAIDIKKINDNVEEVKTAVNEIKAANVTRDEADKKTQAAVDETLIAVKEFKKRGGIFNKDEGSVKSALLTAFGDPKTKAAIASYKENRESVAMQLKAVGDIGSGNFTVSGTQTFVGNQVVPGVGRKPYEEQHVRNILTVIPTERTDSISVLRDAGGEGAPTSVAAGASKPQSDRDYVKLIVPITKIGHHYRIPEEWLEDLEWLAGEISQMGIEELLVVEDAKILNNATSGEFQGLTTATNSTAFAAPGSLASAIDFPNNYDVLVAAWTQLRNLKVSKMTGILVNPADYAAMILTKTTIGDYPFGAPNVTIPNVLGVPIYPTTAMTSDKFLIGDFSQVILAQRAGLSVRFYDQDRDNAILNLVTVVIEERLAVVARRADRLVYGDFSDAVAAINGGS